MRKGFTWIVGFAMAFLAVGPLAPAAHAAGASGKQLLNHSKAAVAGILKVAKTSGGRLDPKNRRQAPFWKSLKEMNSSLRAIGQQVAAKDKKLAATLSKGGRTLAKVKTTWPRVGVKDPKVAAYLKKLDNSYTALRSAHGAEGARARKGGQLTPDERRRLEQIKRSQVEFGGRLAPLQAQARRNHDRATEAALTRLIAQSNRIATAQLAVDSFLAVAILLDNLHGEWDGYSYYVSPGCRDGWGQVDVWVDTTYATYDTYYSETFESYSVETWTRWETSVEIRGNVDYAVNDVSSAEVASLDTFENNSYESLSWESYAEEYSTAQTEQTVVEGTDANLDLAVDSWETEGLEVTTADELAESDRQDVAEEAESATEESATEGDDAADEADDAEAEDDAADEADDAEAEEDVADEADDAEAEEDVADEADDAEAEEDVAAEADDAEAEEDVADEADDAEAEEDVADEADDAEAEEDVADEADAFRTRGDVRIWLFQIWR